MPEAHYHLSALPGVAPWLWRYFLESAPERAAKHCAATRPLIERCLLEHEALIEATGAAICCERPAGSSFTAPPGRWPPAPPRRKSCARFGLNIETLDAEALAAREPHLVGGVGGVHYLDAASVDDPSRLAQAYADLFIKRGGRFFTGDAHSLQEATDGRWSIDTHEGRVDARDLVVALGPWSDLIFRELGYDFPLAVKRGYHMHYAPREGAVWDAPCSTPTTAMCWRR